MSDSLYIRPLCPYDPLYFRCEWFRFGQLDWSAWKPSADLVAVRRHFFRFSDTVESLVVVVGEWSRLDVLEDRNRLWFWWIGSKHGSKTSVISRSRSSTPRCRQMEASAGSGCTSWRPSRARANVARYGPQQVRLPSFFCVKFMTTASRPRPATGAFTYIASEAGRLGSVGVLLLGVALGTAPAFGGPLGWYIGWTTVWG